MKKQPKRIKLWVNEYRNEHSTAVEHNTAVSAGRYTAREARSAARELAQIFKESRMKSTRVAVPLVELRRGELVVDVEALVKEFWRSAPACCTPIERKNFLRAALKKVGVR